MVSECDMISLTRSLFILTLFTIFFLLYPHDAFSTVRIDQVSWDMSSKYHITYPQAVFHVTFRNSGDEQNKFYYTGTVQDSQGYYTPHQSSESMGRGRGVDPLKDIKSSRGKSLDGRMVVLCVTGSVASIEVPSLARELMRHGAEVNAVMSEAAERLVRPETLEWATGNPVVRKLTGKTEHVRLA